VNLKPSTLSKELEDFLDIRLGLKTETFNAVVSFLSNIQSNTKLTSVLCHPYQYLSLRIRAHASRI